MGSTAYARKVRRDEAVRRGPLDRLEARIAGHEYGRMRPGEGSRNDAHAANRSIVADLSPGTEHARPFDHRPVAATGLVWVWNLPNVGAVLDRILRPSAQHQPDLLLEDLAVLAVRRRVVGQGRDPAEVLPEDVGPA